jgi:hypothetical protein
MALGRPTAFRDFIDGSAPIGRLQPTKTFCNVPAHEIKAIRAAESHLKARLISLSACE